MWCLPKELTQKIQNNLKTKGITAEDISNMSSAERLQFFKDAVEDEGTANQVHKSFEDSKQFKKMITKVNLEQGAKITELSNKVKSVEADKDATGNHTLEYFQSMNDLKKYVQSLNENTVTQHLVSLARNFLLTSIKTPVKVFGETWINNKVEGLIKAVSYLKGSEVAPDLVGGYVKNAQDIYQKTDYNLASMNNMGENSMFGDTFSQREGTSTGVKGIIRKTAKLFDRVAIHYEHGLIFNSAFNSSFASSAALEASRIARSEGLTGEALQSRATELFKESTVVGTKSEIPKQIRLQAQQDAMRVTNTNDTYGSAVAKAVKRELNRLVPGLPLGDLTIPFSKVPGNIIANSLGVAGMDLPRAAYEFKKAITDYAQTGKGNFVQPVRTLVRVAGAITAASLIASGIDKNNYNKTTGMIKIGNTWVSLELFGLLGPAIAGILEAKFAKKGENPIYAYFVGAATDTKNLPGISEILGVAKYGVSSEVSNFVSSRISPQIAPDIQKSIDQEDINPLLFGAKVKSDSEVKKEKRDATAKAAKKRAGL